MSLMWSSIVLLLTASCTIASAQQARPIGYVIGMKGDWRDTRTDHVLTPLSLLTSKSELKLMPSRARAAPMIRLRFFEGLCEEKIECTDATPCSKPMPVDQIFSRLADTCRVKGGTWRSALAAAWTSFFQPTQTGEPALAMTLSRAVEGNDDEGDDPVLQEAVLLVDDGRIELSPLFRTAANGAFSLQFCDPGPALTEACAESAEKDRVAVKWANGKPAPAVFSKPEGLYRVRLWRMTPKGQQPTERTAIALVGPKASYAGTQKTYLEMSGPAADLARTDPMIRLMLSAWLAQNGRRSTP